MGELWLIDGDEVEESNLNRQIQYAEADIGRPKAEAMAARLRAFNSRIEVRTIGRRVEGQAQLAEIIAGADLVVDAADWPAHEIEHWCNAACFEAGIPYIAMSHLPPVARAGPLYVPGETGCFSCQDIQYRREYPLRRGDRAAAGAALARRDPRAGLRAGRRPGRTEVMHFLTGLTTPATLGAGYLFDLRTMEVERYEVVPEPECPVCSRLQPTEAG